MRSSLLLATLINELQALNEADQLNSLINDLRHGQSSSPAEISVLILLCAKSYPYITKRQPGWNQLQDLLEDCYQQTSAEEMVQVLNRPENARAKLFFQALVPFALEEQQQNQRPSPKPKRK